jgi:putative SOS response-associated peptidase YedK
MCGRYIIRQQAKALREWERYGPPPFLESYNVAPTQQVPIVRLRDDAPEFASVRWGLVPFFTRGASPPYSTINARIETFETAASYRAPWRRGQRCLQLASGFYEWHLDNHGRKAPYLITVADQALFAFAALWECSRRDDGSVVESCVHITMPGNALLADIHNTGSNPQRMPAIVRLEDRETSAAPPRRREPYSSIPRGSHGRFEFPAALTP